MLCFQSHLSYCHRLVTTSILNAGVCIARNFNKLDKLNHGLRFAIYGQMHMIHIGAGCKLFVPKRPIDPIISRAPIPI